MARCEMEGSEKITFSKRTGQNMVVILLGTEVSGVCKSQGKRWELETPGHQTKTCCLEWDPENPEMMSKTKVLLN